jgi:hypothetical protein
MGTIRGGSATIRSSPPTSAVNFAKTRVLSRVRAFASRPFRTLDLHLAADFLLLHLGADPGHHLFDVDVRIPRLESAHAGRLSDPLPILTDPRHDDRAPVALAGPSVAARDLQARGQTLDVPFPWSGQGLVEVVDVEHHLPLGRAESAEVRQVSVTAELH